MKKISSVPLSILSVSLSSIVLTACNAIPPTGSIEKSATKTITESPEDTTDNETVKQADDKQKTEIEKETETETEKKWDCISERSYNRQRVLKGDFYGFIDYYSENVVVPVEYDYALHYSEELAGVKKDGKWGYIDVNGKTVLPFDYDDAYSFSDGIAHVEKDGQGFYIDKNNKRLFDLPEGYDEEYGFTEGLAGVSDDTGMVGVMDNTGKIILKPTYDQVEYFKNGVAVVERANDEGDDKYGVIDTTGKLIIPIEYDAIDSFNDGVAIAKKATTKGDRFGILAKPKKLGDMGKLIVPVEFDEIRDLSEKIAVVKTEDKNGDKYGAYDTTGNQIIPVKYAELQDSLSGYLVVREYTHDGKLGKYSYFNHDGTLQFPFKFDKAETFYIIAEVTIDDESYILFKSGKLSKEWEYEGIDYDGMVVIHDKNERYGAINQNREVIVEPRYDYISRYKNGVATVHQEGKKGLIDKQGTLLTPIIYDEMTPFSNGVAQAMKEGERLLIDKNNKVIHTFEQSPTNTNQNETLINTFEDDYEFIDIYHFGFASAQKDKKWGAIDKQGKMLIPFKYQMMQRYMNGMFMGYTDSGADIINLKGKTIITPDDGYSVPYIQEGRIAVGKNGKFGFMDLDGRLVIPLQYDKVFPFDQGSAMVQKDDTWQMIDTMGNLRTNTKYADAYSSLNGLTAVQQLHIDKNGISQKNTDNTSGKWGFINSKGKVIIPFEYDDTIIGFVDGEAVVWKGYYRYIINRDGEIIR